MFIFYGKRKTISRKYRDVFMYECPYCEKINTTTLFLQSKFFHVFWIPVAPYEKNGIALCSNCGAKRDELQFGPKLVQELKAVKAKMRHPWWTYLLSGFFGLVILAVVISIIIGV